MRLLTWRPEPPALQAPSSTTGHILLVFGQAETTEALQVGTHSSFPWEKLMAQSLAWCIGPWFLIKLDSGFLMLGWHYQSTII